MGSRGPQGQASCHHRPASPRPSDTARTPWRQVKMREDPHRIVLWGRQDVGELRCPLCTAPGTCNEGMGGSDSPAPALAINPPTSPLPSDPTRLAQKGPCTVSGPALPAEAAGPSGVTGHPGSVSQAHPPTDARAQGQNSLSSRTAKEQRPRVTLLRAQGAEKMTHCEQQSLRVRQMGDSETCSAAPFRTTAIRSIRPAGFRHLVKRSG